MLREKEADGIMIGIRKMRLNICIFLRSNKIYVCCKFYK